MPTTPDRQRRLSALLVMALILTVAVWSTGSGTEVEAVPAARTVHTMTVPAAAFVPSNHQLEYLNAGDEYYAYNPFSYFIAPLQFPYPAVTIKSIALHALDNGTQDVRLQMWRSRPTAGAGAIMATIASDGQSATLPRSFSTTAISPRIINSAYHGAFLTLSLPPGLDYRFYGVTIRYEA